MHTKITDCSYTSVNGYTSRKRFMNSTLCIALKTHDYNEGSKNSSLVTMKFMGYTLTKTTTIENLKILMISYRDPLVTSSRMAALQARFININVDVTNPAHAIPAEAQVIAVEFTRHKQLTLIPGLPTELRMDNGPELISLSLA